MASVPLCDSFKMNRKQSMWLTCDLFRIHKPITPQLISGERRQLVKAMLGPSLQSSKFPVPFALFLFDYFIASCELYHKMASGVTSFATSLTKLLCSIIKNSKGRQETAGGETIPRATNMPALKEFYVKVAGKIKGIKL